VDIGVPGGSALVELVDSVNDGDDPRRQEAQDAVLQELGPESLVDTAAVFGNFQMMNRVAEGTGIPIPPQALEREADMMKALSLYEILKSQQD
jgi:hypothetical protein